MGILARIHNRIAALCAAYRVRVARSAGVQVAAGARIASSAKITFSQSPSIPRRVCIGFGATLDRGCLLDQYGGEIVVGDLVRVGPYSVLYGHGGITIGEGVLIGPHCVILSSNHSIAPADQNIRELPDLVKPTLIEPEVWLGAGVCVLAGVTIGKGAVIGAGSVVTRDIPPFAIAVGTPAAVRSYRKGIHQG